MAPGSVEGCGADRMLELIGGFWSTQALGVAAELGIADRLAAGCHSLQPLASAVGCEAGSLRRLMRALVHLGLCEEAEVDTYTLTRLGERLRTDAPGSLRAWALWTARYLWQPWGEMAECLRTGRTASSRRAGEYGHVAQDESASRVFNRAMEEITAIVADALASSSVFAEARRFIDVGGGHGELAIAVLGRHPSLEGLILDLPHAMPGARRHIQEAGLSGRCHAVEGDFFRAIPRGFDLLVLKSVLHNWDDVACARLLACCGQALERDGRVAIVERVLPQRVDGGPGESLVLRSDLNMLVGHGGRERNDEEIATLLRNARFRMRSRTPLPLGYSLIEAAPSM